MQIMSFGDKQRERSKTISWESKKKMHQFVVCWNCPESLKYYFSFYAKQNFNVVRSEFLSSFPPRFSSPEQGSGWAIVITCRPSTHLNDFSYVTPRPIFFKLHAEPSVKMGS